MVFMYEKGEQQRNILKTPPSTKMEYTPESQIDAPKRISFAILPMEAEIGTR